MPGVVGGVSSRPLASGQAQLLNPDILSASTAIQQAGGGAFARLINALQLLDQSGNVIGVVVARLSDHTQQNVNFAIKVNVLTEFLDTHGVPYSTEASEHPLRRVELAEKAQSIAVLILCEKRGSLF